jgi:hypothetical protein
MGIAGGMKSMTTKKHKRQRRGGAKSVGTGVEDIDGVVGREAFSSSSLCRKSKIPGGFLAKGFARNGNLGSFTHRLISSEGFRSL